MVQFGECKLQSIGHPRVAGLPVRAGLVLRAEHVDTILELLPDLGWFDVRPEAFLADGRLDHGGLFAIRQHYPMSLNCAGWALVGGRGQDPDQLDQLKAIADRYQPASVSVALSLMDAGVGQTGHGQRRSCYTHESVTRLVRHLDLIQSRLARRVMLAAPAWRGEAEDDAFREAGFLSEVAGRSGCGLLLDIAGVFAAHTEAGSDPYAYIDAFPVESVGEVHVAGHGQDSDDHGQRVPTDRYDREVADEVWDLFAHLVARAGAFPTLVKWDGAVPDWWLQAKESKKAEALLNTCGRQSLRKWRTYAVA